MQTENKHSCTHINNLKLINDSFMFIKQTIKFTVKQLSSQE